MAKPTKRQALQMAEEFLSLQPLMERYKYLETQLKLDMPFLGLDEVVTSEGRLFISQSHTMKIDPAVARKVLGDELAGKVIRITEKISNPLIETLHEIGDITPGQMDDLRSQAEKKTITRLHIRPLK